MEPYPAPGPAGRTTALPLRSRIPPLSLNSAWKSKSDELLSVRTMELRQAGSSSRDKALLQGGAAERLCPVRDSCVVEVFPPLCSLPPLTRLIRPPPNSGPSRFSNQLQPPQLQHIRGSGGVATAALPSLSAVRSRCVHGGSETGLPISQPTEFDI